MNITDLDQLDVDPRTDDDSQLGESADPVVSDMRRTEEREKQVSFAHALRTIAGTLEGRVVLAEIFATSRYREISFDPDPLVMSFNEGQRNVANWLEGQLEIHAPGQLSRLMREAQERRKRWQTRRRS